MKTTVKDVFEKAVYMHQKGQVREAEILYKQILEKFPNNGDANHNLKKALMISLAAHTTEELKKRNYHDAIETSLNIGILDYNKIINRELVILGGTTLGEDHCAKHIDFAYNKGCSF